MEITTTASSIANHDLTSSQTSKQPQTVEAEKNQAIKEAVDAVEVTFSREGIELAETNSTSTETPVEVDLSAVDENEASTVSNEAQDLPQHGEDRDTNPSISVFA